MKFRYRILSLFYSLLFFPWIVYPSLSLASKEDLNNQSKVGIDYLDKLPLDDYIIGSGDIIGVIISRDYPEMGFVSSLVDGQGTINIPKLKRVYVEGLTIKELTSVLNQAYKKFIKYPSVEVSIEGYRPIRVLVEGEVQSPGLKTLEGYLLANQNQLLNTTLDENSLLRINGNSSDSPLDLSSQFSEYSNRGKEAREKALKRSFNNKQSNSLKSSTFYFPSIFDAIRESGGITEYTDLSEIQIIRKNNLSSGGGEKTATINFESVLEGDPTNNIRIYDSDIIRIKKGSKTNNYQLRKAVLSNLNPKFINVFVMGKVKSPGVITVSKASVLSDAIDVAGGAKVVRGPVKFIRFKNDGSIDNRKFSFNKSKKRGSYKNPYLKEGDLIVVDSNFISRTSEVFTEFTSPIVGIFSTYGLIKAIND